MWLDLDQKELDDAYDQSCLCAQPRTRCSSATPATARRARASRRAEALRLWADCRSKALDLYRRQAAERAGPRVHPRRRLAQRAAKDYCVPAELFVNAGAHFVVLDFINVLEAQRQPDADGRAGAPRRRLGLQERRRASAAIPNRHLHLRPLLRRRISPACVLVTDWQKDFDVPADVVKGGLFCSGMFDLKPVRLSARSAYVKFTDEMEQALSTQRHLDSSTARCRRAWHAGDAGVHAPDARFRRRREGRRQAGAAAGRRGLQPLRDPETLASPYGLLGRAVLEQMKLTAASAPNPKFARQCG